MKHLIGNLILNLILIFGGIAMLFIKKPNYIIGLRTTDTLSNEKVWIKSNKFAGILLIIAGAILSIINILAYLYKNYLLLNNLVYIFLFALVLITIISSIYAHIYAKRNSIENKKEKEQFIIKNSLIYILIIFSIILIITGLITPFIPQNFLFGIRIAKTFEEPRVWKLANTFSGIGFIIIGIIFTTLFLKVLKKDDIQKTKIVLKYIPIYLIIILGWIIVSILFTYFIHLFC